MNIEQLRGVIESKRNRGNLYWGDSDKSPSKAYELGRLDGMLEAVNLLTSSDGPSTEISGKTELLQGVPGSLGQLSVSLKVKGVARNGKPYYELWESLSLDSFVVSWHQYLRNALEALQTDVTIDEVRSDNPVITDNELSIELKRRRNAGQWMVPWTPEKGLIRK
jgi:hypothetical protein